MGTHLVSDRPITGTHSWSKGTICWGINSCAFFFFQKLIFISDQIYLVTLSECNSLKNLKKLKRKITLFLCENICKLHDTDPAVHYIEHLLLG